MISIEQIMKLVRSAPEPSSSDLVVSQEMVEEILKTVYEGFEEEIEKIEEKCYNKKEEKENYANRAYISELMRKQELTSLELLHNH